MYICEYENMDIYIYIYIILSLSIYIYIYLYREIPMYVCIYMCIHIYNMCIGAAGQGGGEGQRALVHDK